MKFTFDKLLAKAIRLAQKHGGEVTINLPFLSIAVSPDDAEKKAAREVMILLADNRVLNSKECCDNCIDLSLDSLQAIRTILLERQVALSALSDGSVYLLLEFMAEGVRQFLTATERRKGSVDLRPDDTRGGLEREEYFEALEVLRFHFHSCMLQLSKIAAVEPPRVAEYLRSQAEWHQLAYSSPKLLDRPGDKG